MGDLAWECNSVTDSVHMRVPVSIPSTKPEQGRKERLLLRVMLDQKLRGGKVSFGGGIVERQGTCVCGDG